jgi:hypothetical protein
MARIFISYRRDDAAAHANLLRVHLTNHFGQHAVFMDVNKRALPPGADWPSVLEEEAESCDALLAVIGPHWLKIEDAAGKRRILDPYDVLRAEIRSALQRRAYVVPVLVGGAPMPQPDELPEDLSRLARINALVLHDDDTSEFAVKQLIEAIEAALKAQAKRKADEEAKLAREAKAKEAEARRLENENEAKRKADAKREREREAEAKRKAEEERRLARLTDATKASRAKSKNLKGALAKIREQALSPGPDSFESEMCRLAESFTLSERKLLKPCLPTEELRTRVKRGKRKRATGDPNCNSPWPNWTTGAPPRRHSQSNALFDCPKVLWHVRSPAVCGRL